MKFVLLMPLGLGHFRAKTFKLLKCKMADGRHFDDRRNRCFSAAALD